MTKRLSLLKIVANTHKAKRISVLLMVEGADAIMKDAPRLLEIAFSVLHMVAAV
jgi:hypothetical protein